MVFFICKVIHSVLTSCLMSSFFSEMPSCENVEKNSTAPCYHMQYLLRQVPFTNLAPRSHSLYGVTKVAVGLEQIEIK